MEKLENKHLTTFEVAKYCKVSHRTVQKWILEGKLGSYRTPGNHSRIKHDDFLEFLNKYKMPIPDELSGDGKKRILVVDDDLGLVTLISSVLKKNGDFEIDTAYNGFNAGSKYVEFKPDLITLDIRMPKMDGYEVLQQLRDDAEHKSVKVIVISGFTDESEKTKAIHLGADAIIDKPFNNKVLISKVNELLGIKQPAN